MDSNSGKLQACSETVGALCADSHPGAYTGQDAYTGRLVVHALTGEGFDASEDGSGRETPIMPIAFHGSQDPDVSGDVTHPCGRNNGLETCVAFSCKDHGADASSVAPTLRGMGHDESHANAGGQVAVAFQTRIARNGRGQPEEICPALSGADAGETSDMRPCVVIGEAVAFSGRNRGDDGRGYDREPQITGEVVGTLDTVKPWNVAGAVSRLGNLCVRRLTPRECERLQGFPDDYTLVPFHGKPACDGPRYKAIGNSWAVPCARWIGERLHFVDSL